MDTPLNAHPLPTALARLLAGRARPGEAARTDRGRSALARRNEALARELEIARGACERAEDERRALAGRHDGLLDALPLAIVVRDAAGIVVQANTAARRLLGTDPAGRRWASVIGGLDAGIDCAEHTAGACGTVAVVLRERAPAPDLAAATRVNKLTVLGESAARLAHQLRSPLASALLYAAQLERDDPAPAERARCARNLAGRLRQLERMTREVLAYARGDEPTVRATGIEALFAEATEVMAPLMAARGISFTCADLTGGAQVCADRGLIGRALVALLENALEATAQGGKVRVTALANNARVRLCVDDTGCGVPIEARERLFEPFYTTRPSGTGLGLAIVRDAVRACGGSVELRSAPGEGSCFTLVLPRARIDAGTGLRAEEAA